MQKSIIKNLLAITFALGALVFVAGKVHADLPVEPEIQGTTYTCFDNLTLDKRDGHVRKQCSDCCGFVLARITGSTTTSNCFCPD